MECARAWVTVAALALCVHAGPGPPAPPALRFTRPLYNVSIPENSPPRSYATQPAGEEPLAVLLPSDGARVRFRIRHGDREKFFKAEERTVGDRCFLFIRTRAALGEVLNRERRAAYRLEVRASVPGSPDADTTVLVTVSDVNDLSPLFYPTEYEASVPEDTPPHSSVVRVFAEDADLGINGEIYYSLEDSADHFVVHPTSGVISLTRALSVAEKSVHELTVLARDRASLMTRGRDAPAARAQVSVRVAPVNLHAPELRVRHLPELLNYTSFSEIYAIVEVVDRDVGDNGRIESLDIVDGDPDGHFRVQTSTQLGEYEVIVHSLLNRGTAPHGYNLTLRATDCGHPPRTTYATVPVLLTDTNDNAPVFTREVYEASVSETAPPNTPVIRLKVNDRDQVTRARVYIEIVGGNEGAEFTVNPETGVLYTSVELDAEKKAQYTLTVSAIDQGDAGTRKQSSAKVKISVLDMNDNDPTFEQEVMETVVSENGPGGTVVARVVAHDADSGENAYISYSIANLHPVPFDVDHFSGTVRTTRLLDYESMRREYTLRIRASDWGLPYRRQAEMRLLVTLRDINDNRPQFERGDCVGYLPRRLPIASEIVTLSAIDFDAGDVVSYRIVSGNDDTCFSLDSGTGVLTLACDLNDIGTESRILNVTSTDGTHFSDATSLTLHLVSGSGDASALECRDTEVARRLTDLLAAAERNNAAYDPNEEFPLSSSRYGENLHAPQFVDFPVEVKVNESVALGTSLVRLSARDRDLGYNGLLTYGISGGDDDSAFRIDPESGELKVIGYLDREREIEYYLNVTVYDLGRPRRSSSRLLPVTVLDVNDNVPRFEKSLASLRVTENALNGTVIFCANATDPDTGAFGRVRYGISAGAEGEFCVDAESGSVSVCAPLDRERRALYELRVRATDGGGRWAEAGVRVAVEDVNDCAPRFALPSYGARVREDLPPGSPVAIVDATDADLGDAGRVTYSLPEQPPDDVTFAIDSSTGTLRTTKHLDYEQRQVYGVTVRAADGGSPSLWTETTVVVEVDDVDENLHAPAFADLVLSGAVREDAPPGTAVMRAAARDADPPGRDSRLAYYVLAGSGMAHFTIDDTGTVRTLSPLDRETTPQYWLTVCAEDLGLVPRASCVPVHVHVEDVNDVSPWPRRAAYTATVTENSPAGTHVAHVHADDGDATPAPTNVTYTIIAGNPDGLFTIDRYTGEIVTSGRSLDREVAHAHALEVRCSDGELATSVRVSVAVADINEHAPAFTQRAYELSVPLDDDDDDVGARVLEVEPTESSAESDGDDDEEGGGAAGWGADDDTPTDTLYVGTVLALDPDSGANGSVRYSVRARGALRVGAGSGRVYARRVPAEGTVRACDGGRPARCGAARVTVRRAPSTGGGGGAPSPLSPPPLQVAELEPPGTLLAELHADDPDGDNLYYDIVAGDPRQEFHVGREDGSLVVARRLLHERQAQYSLRVRITDGTHSAHATVNISVINDVNEGGVAFSQEVYEVDVSESAPAGTVVTTLRAAVVASPAGVGGASDARLLYGVWAARAPVSARLFRLHELTGVLELAMPLDRESAAIHELTVWARDQAPRASRAFARVVVRVGDADEHAPEWGRRLWEARVPRGAAPGALVAALRAADRDAEPLPLRYSLVGGDATMFAVDPALGELRLSRPFPTAAREFALLVRASGPPPTARASDLPLHVTVIEPDDAPPRFGKSAVRGEVPENSPGGTVVTTVEVRSATPAWLSLSGGRGLFRLNPTTGVLVTAAPLDYEAQPHYDLTVTAVNMGGGEASVPVSVSVLDRNEFPPRLTRRSYSGRVSEDAAAGALVADADSPGPLVLVTEDADSPAHRQRSYELSPPAAARLFRVDDTTGALLVAAPLDYELAHLHEFTVKVSDGGSPPVPSDSWAEVRVEVEDVNDCAPRFARDTYAATVVRPTVAGAAVARLAATDGDRVGGELRYEVADGDERGTFAVASDGTLTVVRADELADEYSLRVRVSDGRHWDTARVHVHVRDPEHAGLAFQKPEYFGAVLENSTKPTTVCVLNVLGAELNEHIEFTLLNPVDGFQVGRSSGAVRSTGVPLDREVRDTYTLVVEARAGGGAADASGGTERAARARVHVSVSDVNDNCPVFVGRPYEAGVRAGGDPGTELLRVRAIDADAGDNGQVRYEMKRGPGELFRVDRGSGALVLRQSLDAHTPLYSLLVAAYDGGSPACGAEVTVRVRVWGGGAAPAWDRAHYVVETPEDAPLGATLTPLLQAVSPLQRPLIYTLQHTDRPDLFEINFETGALVVAGELDYERAHEHALTVRATDGVTGAAADVSVTVRLRDVNDCAPAFVLARDYGVLRANVSEAARVGHIVLRLRATDNDTGVNGEVIYSVWESSGETPAPFAVDGRDGALRVAAPLDRERRARYHLRARADDAGSPPLHDTVHVFVTVEDVNDCAPVVERSVVSVCASSGAAVGTVVGRVRAWDPDVADAGRLRWAARAPHPALAVDPATGLVSVADPAALLSAPRSLNVSVSDGAHATFARIKLTPAPDNRSPPNFPHLVHEARALENQPPPLLLTTVKAYDEDPGEFGAVTYWIPSERLRETFALDARTGALTTRVPLDREARAEWEVPVVATDGGGLVRHTTVRVRVVDLDDNAPTFPLSEYHATVRADAAPLHPFLEVGALDADAGDHARLVYSLLDADEDADTRGLFAVDPHSGALSFARNASSLASRTVQTWVRARDGGGLAGEVPVSVRVLGAGEVPPTVAPLPPDLFLREDAPLGTLVAELRADAAHEHSYTLAGAGQPFAVDASGRVTLVGPLDRETRARHRLGVVARRGAAAVLLQTTVHVLDVNEHAPRFHSHPYSLRLAENTPPHTNIVQLMAEDLDAGANGEVRFSLVEPSALFAVDSQSGWVRTLAPLDRETAPEHRLGVVATDGGEPPRASRGSLVVRLQDYNDCPPTFRPARLEADVREDAPPGTVVARLRVEDADATAAPLSFFVGGGDPRARLQVRPSGEVVVARALDRDAEPTLHVTVLATDGKFTAAADLALTVRDVNDNPPYCVRHRYSAVVREDAAPGTSVARLLTGDGDEPHNARLRYFLTGDDHHHFRIDKESGAVSVAGALDRERRALYELTAHASDRDRAEWSCGSELRVTIVDVNDNAPSFSALEYFAALPEDAEPGTLVAKVHATDADLGENRLVRYSFEGGTGGLFELDGESGIIRLRGALDRETQAEHRAVVRAWDGGRPPLSATATVRLTVADVNDNPPEFEFATYRAVAAELDAVGTELLRVRALSRDAGVNADVYYSIVAGEGRDDFALDRTSGVLTVARPLDYETRSEYFLTVQAIDGGEPPLSDRASVNVTVADANDNSPVFPRSSYGARVREDEPRGSRVLQLVANDADSGANGRIAYSIARGDRDNRFAIDPDTGYLSVAAPLDRESTPAYVLEVRARDRGIPPLETTTLVNVEITDANDNPPLFAQTNYSAVVQEDRPLGYTVLKFLVNDADAPPNGAPYTFDFQSGNEMGAFRLEQDGYLRSATRFNHRIKDRYVLQVRVFDNGTPPLFSDAWVYVRVIEESQYPPAVTPLEVVVNSYLDEFPGGEIGRVYALDRDAYDTLSYALAPCDGAPYAATDLFDIDAVDGTLRAAARLDLGDYRLNVTVADGKFTSFAIVKVAVVLISEETLAQAIVVRFREVTDRNFVLSHRKGFVRAVSEATDCDATDVVIVSVQAAGDGDGARGRRQVAQDLDVAVAVRALPADALRRRLLAHVERLEERARLVLEELLRASCGGCVRGACLERVELRPAAPRVVATDVFSLVAPAHRLRADCACEPGFEGARCDRPTTGAGAGGDPAEIVQLAGDGCLAFGVEGGVVAGARPLDDELMLSLRFRTRRPRGVLVSTAGVIDYLVLEVVEGFVQVRMELGSGEARVRAGGGVADGAWHEARVERRGAALRLVVDGHAARALTPPPAAVLDASPRRLVLGAKLDRLDDLADEQVTLGFEGCLSEVRLSGVTLPLGERSLAPVALGSGVTVAQLSRVRAPADSVCKPLPLPTPCSSYPCLNGGSCIEVENLVSGSAEGFRCTCPARFGGARCERDSAPCASAPCLHGGRCAPADDGDGAGAYRCECAAGLSGARCELGRWCTPGVCAHGGGCEEGAAGPSCRCRGYFGALCEFDVDECAGEPCLNGATCLNEPGSFRCLCPPDKTGMNCGNPLYSDAVVAGEGGGQGGGRRSLAALWRWALTARWPLGVGGVVLAALAALCVVAPVVARRLYRAPPPPSPRPLNGRDEKAPRPPRAKLSNLAARPSSLAGGGIGGVGAPLNNLDTLRSYGSAGDELEGIPPDYLRNLNIEPAPDRKPWSEQMHLHTFVDNKIYNDLKSNNRARVVSPLLSRRGVGTGGGVGGGGGEMGVGVYHWDCSDWCGGGALPGISEVPGTERRDSSDPLSDPPATLVRDTDSADDDRDRLPLTDDADDVDDADASSYLLHPDEYLPPATSDGDVDGDAEPTTAPRRRADPDAASLITMLEERRSLLGGGGAGSGSDLSANLCEIEDSDVEEPPPRSPHPPHPPRYTAV